MTDEPVIGDAVGAMLYEQWSGGGVVEVIERDDGYVMAGRPVEHYLSEPGQWSAFDRAALQRCTGRVLDLGAGGGRASLELQCRGSSVLALDTSAGAVEVCRGRGVRDTFEGTVFDLLAREPHCGFESILLLDNNIGLLESPAAAPRLLDTLARATGGAGRIVGVGRDPYATEDPDHLRYHARNRAAGRHGGEMRMRVRHRRTATPWFPWWFLAPGELAEVVAGTGWRIEELREERGNYLVVLTMG
ncbi:methyltransferase domain-containing protein [Nocardia sp. NPDC003963]